MQLPSCNQTPMTTNNLIRIQQHLLSAPQILAAKKIAAGFDGFVDSVVRVVNFKTEENGPVYFNTINEFGNYISAKSGSGSSLESHEQVLKLGGNMPIMANAMAQMGCYINCVGAFGTPTVVPAFAQMHARCSLYSYTNPGFTTAMEFTDGKIMLAQMTDLNYADWSSIRDAIGLNQLKDIYADADLVCLVNWSEPDHSNHMWQGLINDVLTHQPKQPQRRFFFDLSDCSKRPSTAIASAIQLIQQFTAFGKVILSLNRNEAGILYKTLFNTAAPDELKVTGDKLFTALNIHTLIIHNSKLSAAWDAEGMYESQPVYIAEPRFSTGAGDNFNAGYCIATLLGLNAELSLIVANATSNRYITTGISPGLAELNAYISELIIASL
jgi:hypothetical protein